MSLTAALHPNAALAPSLSMPTTSPSTPTGAPNYNSNGTLPMVPMPDQGGNPWAGMAAGDSASVPGQVAAGNAGVSQMQNQMSTYSAQTSPYPTYQNAAGLGTGTAYQQQSNTPTAPDTSSRGFNPWSLQGEAMARGQNG